MSDDKHPATHELVMPFLTVASKGGPHDDRSYTCGWEMGTLDADMRHCWTPTIERTIHADNQPQADLIAMKNGFAATFQPSPDAGWVYMKATRAAEALRP